MKCPTTYLLIFMYCAVFSGCGAGKLEVKKYDSKTDTSEIVYTLPKTLIKVEIPLSITQITWLKTKEDKESDDNNDPIYKETYSAKIGTISVTPFIVPDDNARYAIKTNITNSATWQNDFQVNLNKSGNLTSSEVTYDDGTSDVIKSFGSVATSLAAISVFSNNKDFAKFSAKIANDKVKELTKELGDLKEKKNSTYNQYMLENDAKLLQVYENKIKRLEEAITAIEDKIDKTNSSKITYDIVVEQIIDPKRGKNEYKINWGQYRDILSEFKYEDLELSLHYSAMAESSIFGNQAESKKQVEGKKQVYNNTQADDKTNSVINAYVYRIPQNVRYELRGNKENKAFEVLKSGYIDVNQLGTLGTVHIDYRRFAKKKTTVTLHAETGGLSKYQVTTTGVAAKNLAETANNTIQIYNDIVPAKEE